MSPVSNVRCSRCGRFFGLDLDLVSAWLEEHKEEHPKHYPAQCQHCHRMAKVPMREIARWMPRKEDA